MSVLSVTAVRTYEEMQCGGCGVWFAMESRDKHRRQQEHGSFKCPNGCSRQFCGETEAQKLTRQLSVEQRRVQEAEERLRAARVQIDIEARRARAMKGERTKLRKRLAAGCCPACRRTFQNMAEHMRKQHPEFGASEAPST